jgi:large subunit ribosomal protein L24
MNAAKHAQKLKHIRKIKAAIRFREAEKKRLAPIIKENKESKQYILQRLRHEHETTKSDIVTARQNAKEDWYLGPLRPNRAIGVNAERYGVMDRKQLRDPEIPKHWFGAKESVQKRMKYKIPENVLRNQWPIVKGDRVVVIRGRELNKIGEVEDVVKESNQIVIKDMNKVYHPICIQLNITH